MRILSGWSEWAFITPRPLKNKLELPFDDGQDEENGLNRIVLMTHIVQFLVNVHRLCTGGPHWDLSGLDDGDFDEGDMRS